MGALHSRLAESQPGSKFEDDNRSIKAWPLLGEGEMPYTAYKGGVLTGSSSSMDPDELCIEDRSSRYPSWRF